MNDDSYASAMRERMKEVLKEPAAPNFHPLNRRLTQREPAMGLFEKSIIGMLAILGMLVCLSQAYRYGQHHPGTHVYQALPEATSYNKGYKDGAGTCQ